MLCYLSLKKEIFTKKMSSDIRYHLQLFLSLIYDEIFWQYIETNGSIKGIKFLLVNINLLRAFESHFFHYQVHIISILIYYNSPKS